MKNFKSIIAGISALTMLLSGTMSAVAFPTSYEQGSNEYEEYRSSLTSVPYQDKLVELLSTAYPDLKIHNVYYNSGCSDELFKDVKFDTEKYTYVNEYKMEIDDPNNNTPSGYRRFIGTRLYFNQLNDMDGAGGVLPASVDEMNDFLKENGYNALIEVKQLYSQGEDGIDKLYITYGDEVDTKSMIDILYALYKKYDLEPHQYGLDSIVIAGASLSDWEQGDPVYDAIAAAANISAAAVYTGEKNYEQIYEKYYPIAVEDNGVTIHYSVRKDKNDGIFYFCPHYHEGIKIKVPSGTDISKMSLKYNFKKMKRENVIQCCQDFSLASEDMESDYYIYDMGQKAYEDKAEELNDYAEKLKNIEGIGEVERFSNEESSYGFVYDEIVINNIQGDITLDKLESDAELMDYIRSLSENAVLAEQRYNSNLAPVFVIKGIDYSNINELYEIRNKINAFSSVRGNADLHRFLYNSDMLPEYIKNAKNAVSGDANGDNSLSVQDCSFIAQALANRKGDELPESADYNKDGKKNVIDAMEIAKDLAKYKNK